MSNLNNLSLVYNTCQQYGVNNDMIAEILGLSGVTGNVVAQYFTDRGFNGTALGFNAVDTTPPISTNYNFNYEFASADLAGHTYYLMLPTLRS